MNRISIQIVVVLLLLMSNAQAQFLNIKNDVFWNTKDEKKSITGMVCITKKLKRIATILL
jgi:hypothetical protein